MAAKTSMYWRLLEEYHHPSTSAERKQLVLAYCLDKYPKKPPLNKVCPPLPRQSSPAMSSPSPPPAPSPKKRRSTTKAKQQRATTKKDPTCRACKLPGHAGPFSTACMYHVTNVDHLRRKYAGLKHRLQAPTTQDVGVNTDAPKLATVRRGIVKKARRKVKTIIEEAIAEAWITAATLSGGSVVNYDKRDKRCRSV